MMSYTSTCDPECQADRYPPASTAGLGGIFNHTEAVY